MHIKKQQTLYKCRTNLLLCILIYTYICVYTVAHPKRQEKTQSSTSDTLLNIENKIEMFDKSDVCGIRYVYDVCYSRTIQ